MEFVHGYNSTSDTSGECSNESNDELYQNQSRSVYLVTYSQANKEEIPTHAFFAHALVKSFEHVGAEVIQWCCSEKNHEEGGTHYHVAMKLKRVTRWIGSKKYLKERHGITVHYSNRHHNYYSAWRYVTKSDESYEESEGHPDLKNNGKPKTSKASETVKENGRKRRSKSVNRKGKKAKKRLTALEVSQVMLTKKITTMTELQALAYEQTKEGKQDLMQFLLNRSRKVVTELLETTWEIKQAGDKLERARKTRLQILQDTAKQECSAGCNGEWIRCAIEVLRNNNVNKAEFSRSVQELLEKGRGKYRNVMITGPANCGKTFILKPLTLIYDTFSNPASGSFAWIGVQEKECIFLNDFRWSTQLIPWHNLLLMLEGELVHLPAPKTHFSKDIQLVKDTPIFCTTKRPLLYVKNGIIDDRETDMMAVRWKMFEFKYQIPEESQRRIEPCPSCFAKFVLH